MFVALGVEKKFCLFAETVSNCFVICCGFVLEAEQTKTSPTPLSRRRMCSWTPLLWLLVVTLSARCSSRVAHAAVHDGTILVDKQNAKMTKPSMKPPL
jgi:hypothetical protein